jgi:methyl-accepting chemotaxis protein
MKIGHKILTALVASILVATTLALVAYQGSHKLSVDIDELSGVKIPSIVALDIVNEGQTNIWGAVNGLSIARLTGSDLHRQYFEAIEAARKRIEPAWKQYEALPFGPGEEAAWNQAKAAWARWERPTNEIIELARERHRLVTSGVKVDDPKVTSMHDRIFALLAETQKPSDEVTEQITKVVQMNKSWAKDLAVKAASGIAATNTLVLSGLVLAAALLLAVGMFLSRSIGKIIGGLVSESRKVTDAVLRGDLRVRADEKQVNFEFRAVAEGMNQTVDAFVKPIQVTADYVDRIAKGNLPPKITDTYEGDFNRIKQNLNGCIDTVHALIEDAVALSRAAVEGKLSTRADAARHQGDYRKIVQGVNDTLDAVMGPINEAAAVLEKLAQRDLTVRVKGSYQGDHARIKEALNASGEALHEAMAQVAQAVEQVSSASGQIAASSESVAAGASEQASSLEETSSSLESMASMTRQAAGNAQQASGLAEQAKLAATEGSAAMEQMSGAMGKIKAAAAGTSQIIKDINEIAFQTNLLALNAAVEAARAGDAGRGFAVVAEEVRSLALRCKEAANKTEELIRQSVHEAGEGEVTARHVHQKLGEIAGSVTKVTDIVAEIAAASKEQTAGIDQVNKAIAQMNQVTQQNAANSEESSSAAAELSGQSEELASMIATFRCERAGSVAKRPAVVKATTPALAQPRKATMKASSGLAGRKNGAALAVSPETIIPLDGDIAFKEF